MIYMFTVPGTLPTMNEILAAAKSMKYAREKKYYTEMVAWAAKAAKLPKLERVRVNCYWYLPDKQHDPDNIEAGKKFVLDGIVMAGVLKNDGWKQIAGFRDDFFVDRENPRVEIELMEVGA